MLSYLDAATGQMLMAALTGGVVGVLVLLKVYWYRLTGVFSKKQRAKADEAQLDLLGERADKVRAKQDDASADADVAAPH